MTVQVRPLDLTGGSPEEVTESLRLAVASASPGVLVLDAVRLGSHVDSRRRVVEVLRRAEAVIVERMAEEGVTRLVRVNGVELVDAGARTGDDGVVAFPPEHPDEAADRLWTALERRHAVLLTSRAGRDGRAVVLAARGDAPVEAAAFLESTSADAVVVTGLGTDPTATSTPGLGDARLEAVRAALGVVPGSADAVDVGLPTLGNQADPVETRVQRACRAALRRLPEISPWHPVRKHLRTEVDPSRATATVLQIGVRLDAPDDLTLGVAIGRLVVALAGEGVCATPIQHDVSPHGVGALVAFLGDDATA